MQLLRSWEETFRNSGKIESGRPRGYGSVAALCCGRKLAPAANLPPPTAFSWFFETAHSALIRLDRATSISAGRMTDSDKRLDLAYDAAQKKLSLQDSTLSNTRTRANNLLATSALFISFSAGVGLVRTDPTRGAIFPACAAWVLLVVVVALGVSVLIVVWPVKNWCYVPSASIIMQKIAAGDDEVAIRRHVINAMIEGSATNATALSRKQDAFRVAVVLLVLLVALLVGALAIQLRG
ncbi:hypothetical protein [Mycolicibacterium elephantis]